MDEIERAILDDGYIYNDSLYRKWITSQVMRRSEFDEESFGIYFISNKPYTYEWQTAYNEINVLSKISLKELKTREKFFNRSVIRGMLLHYLSTIGEHIDISDDMKLRILKYANALRSAINNKVPYKNLKITMDTFMRNVPMPRHMKKSQAWITAFTNAGAYYTADTLIKFKNYRVTENKNKKDLYESLRILDTHLNCDKIPNLTDVLAKLAAED